MGSCESRILGEDRLLELAQLLTRLDAQLLVEQPAALPVRVERVGLPSRAVQGEHELPPQPLTQRVFLNESLELGNEPRVAAEIEVGSDPLFDCRKPLFFQASAFGARDESVEVGECRATPEGESLA